jgi:ribonuclease HI
MARQKFYVIWSGRNTGIFDNWDECRRNVEGYPDPKYKAFESYEEAVKAFSNKSSVYIKKKPLEHASPVTKSHVAKPVANGLAVDAACSGNPGTMEYRGVDLQSGQMLFHKGPYFDGTNNIGEFLAIVHALAYLKKHNSNQNIYTDSMTALSWVKNKKANTKLAQTARNGELFDLIHRAENWLKKNSYFTPILKWDTERWGEIPADFGRK